MDQLLSRSREEKSEIVLKLTKPKNKSAVEIYGLPESFDKKTFKKQLSKKTASSVSIKKRNGVPIVFAMGDVSDVIVELLATYNITDVAIVGR